MRSITDFTISMWLKPGVTGGRIFDFGSGTSKFMILNYSGGEFRYKLTDGSKTVDRNNIACQLPEGEWSHVALTQSGSVVKLFVNGNEIASVSNAPTPSIMGKTAANYLGKSQWSNDPHPDFGYDDFYIFNRSMDQAEIKNLMTTESISEVTEIIDSHPVKTIYYSIDGVKISHPEKGMLVIEQSIMSDGSIKTSKKIAR